MQFDTPIVLFVYNRVETTRRVFDVIKTIKPLELFIVADGPKDADDKIKVGVVREIVNQVDWNCTLKIIDSESNLGCMERISSGLNWVFEQVDRAIVLEDDCLPHIDFFQFCNELLSYHENDEDIMHISGFNILNKVNTESSYFYSKFILPPWGWATWKRAWEKFNNKLDTWQQIKSVAFKNLNQTYFADWTDMFEHIRLNRTTWDTPWNVDIWKHQALGIIPNRSLVQNIGYGEDATFMKNNNISPFKIENHEMAFPLKHPIERKALFDDSIEKEIIEALRLNLLNS